MYVLTQSSRTLFYPMDYSPPGSSVHGIFPGKNTGVGSHVLLQENLPNLGSEPMSLTPLALVGGFFTTSATWEDFEGDRGVINLVQTNLV